MKYSWIRKKSKCEKGLGKLGREMRGKIHKN